MLEGSSKKEHKEIFITIVVPFRNEVNNLLGLLKALEALDYKQELLEIILMNDHSDDGSEQLIEEFTRDKRKFNYKIENLEKKSGKKAALNQAIKLSKGELIVQTDADCIFKPQWLNSIVNVYCTREPNLILGRVQLVETGTLFNFLQRIEQEILMALTYYTVKKKRAIMANGANIAFPKAFYNEAAKFRDDTSISSGDDIFLLQAAKTIDRKKISFNNNLEGNVITTAASDFTSFLEQRTRWAKKSRFIKDKDTRLFGSVIFITNLIAVAFIIFCFFNEVTPLQLAIFMGIKFIVDTLFILSYNKQISNVKILAGSLMLSIIYPFYSIGIALLSLLYQPTWKGRQIKRA